MIFARQKSNRGSVLVFSLIVLFIGVVAALGIASTTIISQKMSGTIGKSVKSFQIADSGAEIMLKKIKDANLTDSISSLGSCSSGEVSGSIAGGSGKSYKITFFDNSNSSVQLGCGDIVSKVAKIKSVGSYGDTNRAIEAAVIVK